MLQALRPIQPSALPALLFLIFLPLFLLFPPKRTSLFFLGCSAGLLILVAGPLLAAGLLAAILLGYGLAEAVARIQRWRGATLFGAVLACHAGYFACFYLPAVADFGTSTIRPSDRAGVFVLFSGIGLTFFRLLSYLVDRTRPGQTRMPLADYLAYMLYFPQFRHGPIERGYSFISHLRQARTNWSWQDAARGLVRSGVGIGGLALASALASAFADSLPDHLRRYPLAAYSRPEDLSTPQLLLLIHLPGLVLYLSESSFASIQLGVSRVFGVRGSENFHFPLLAASPRDLWRRWNVTLSLWLRDYVYIPLGGARRHKYLNVGLTFVYCGLLHGLQPRCLAWGLWAGLTMAAYLWIRDLCIGRRRPAAWPGQTGPMRALAAVVARAATFHWFCIGVTIIMDPAGCGWPVLRQYARALAALIGP